MKNYNSFTGQVLQLKCCLSFFNMDFVDDKVGATSLLDVMPKRQKKKSETDKQNFVASYIDCTNQW